MELQRNGKSGLLQGALMKKSILFASLAVILGGSIAAYFYWQHSQPKPEPEPAQIIAPPALVPKPEVQQVIETPPAKPQLPVLAESDNFMLDALAGLVGNKSLMKLFHTEKIIHNIVATIDNLPRSRAPVSVMPVEAAPGKFITAGTEDDLEINPDFLTSRPEVGRHTVAVPHKGPTS